MADPCKIYTYLISTITEHEKSPPPRILFQMNQKLSNHFWNTSWILYSQITQTLKFHYTQYICNCRINIFWPFTHPNPNWILCFKNDRDTWPHLLSTCDNQHLEGLKISIYNKVVHLIVQTLQANKFTRFFTLINACTHANAPPTPQSHNGSSDVHASTQHAIAWQNWDQISYAYLEPLTIAKPRCFLSLHTHSNS